MSANIRQQITDQLIEAIEAGRTPWMRGWVVPLLHSNAISGNAYSGINNLLLSLALSESGNCADNRWATFKQAKAKGYSIKKGAKASHICRLVEVDRRDTSEGEEVVAEDKQKMLVMKTYAVFNGSDIEGLPPMPAPILHPEPEAAVQAILSGLRASGMVYLEGGNSAFYAPKMDTLKMPDRRAFKDATSHAATLLHECGHATGHPKRLDRFGKLAFVDSVQERAREEIRVEMAASFLCAELGLDLGKAEIENHGAYLSSWLDAIKGGKLKNEIFRAAADAQKIADHLKAHALTPAATSEMAAGLEPVQAVQMEPTPVTTRRRAGMGR